jgi:hypothetical protein
VQAIQAAGLPAGFAIRNWREAADGRAWERIWGAANDAHYVACQPRAWLARGRTVTAGGRPLREGSFEFVYGRDRALQARPFAPRARPLGSVGFYVRSTFSVVAA